MKILTKLRRHPLKYSMMVGTIVVCLHAFINLAKGPLFLQKAPYPPSPLIKNVSWDFAHLTRLALGSDIWATTWAADGNIYTSWGDGTGFGNGGNGPPDRVGLGFARIEGLPNNLKEFPFADQNTFNVWGGQLAENPAQFQGKPQSLLSVDGVLYVWLNNEQYDPRQDYFLAWSSDLGASWTKGGWLFKGEEFGEIAFLNFGKDYQGARDNYVYMYGVPSRKPGPVSTIINLARVPKTQIRERPAYEFFTGFNPVGNPLWGSDISRKEPVFIDSRDVGLPSVSYNPGIERYILTTSHADALQNLGVFDAVEPWGPWTTVFYSDNWGEFSGWDLGYYFPTKWISADGKTMWMVFSGTNKSNLVDSFNLIKAELTLNTNDMILQKETGIGEIR